MTLPIFSWREAIQLSDLPALTRLVLLNLSIYMNDKGGSCHPSIAEQMKDTGLSNRVVCKHLQIAVEGGFLFKQRVGLKGRRWKHNEYQATFPAGVSVFDTAAAEKKSCDDSSLSGNSPSDSGDIHEVTESHTNSSENSPPLLDLEKKNTKKKRVAKVTLAAWEADHHTLCTGHMQKWIRDKSLDERIIAELIEGFRHRMQGSGNEYADFAATFKDWLTRGFLPKPLSACIGRPTRAGVILHGGTQA